MNDEIYRNSMVAMTVIIVIILIIGLVFICIAIVNFLDLIASAKKITDGINDFAENVGPKIGTSILKELPSLTSNILDVDTTDPKQYDNSSVPEISAIEKVLGNKKITNPKVQEAVKYIRPILSSIGNVITDTQESLEKDDKMKKNN